MFVLRPVLPLKLLGVGYWIFASERYNVFDFAAKLWTGCCSKVGKGFVGLRFYLHKSRIMPAPIARHIHLPTARIKCNNSLPQFTTY
jgi:hypothetical protein